MADDRNANAATADSGNARYDTYVVEAKDTISNYAENLWNRNTELQQKFPRLKDGKLPLWGSRGMVLWLVNFNNNLPANERPQGWQKITSRNGELCDGTPERSPHLREGRTFVYPDQVNEIFEPQKPCPVKPAVPADIAPPPPAPAALDAAVAVAAASVASTTPIYQAITNSAGTMVDGSRYDNVDFFVGKPPQDAAANKRGASDRQRDGLRPGKQEGRIVDTSSRSATRDGFSSFAETLQVPFLGGTPGGLVTLARGKPGHEIEFERGQHYLRDNEGNPIAPNPKNRRKLESGFELERDSDGVIRTTQAMLAQISDNRRRNPDYKGVFGLIGLREADTAHNLNRPLTNTGEGLQWTATYMGAEKWYEKTDTAFRQAPNAAAAEKMLQLNLQMAMHPLVWSKDSYGVPVQKIEALRSEMQRVVDALPEGADKARLTSTYITPYSAVMDDNVKLAAAIKQNGGRAGWINPMRDWADERLTDKKLVRDFSKVPFTDEVREQLREHPENRREIINNFYQAEARRFGYLAADQSWDESIRAATVKEMQLGRGQLNDAAGQRESALSPARVELLQHLRDNPAARAAWMDHMLATPGGLQNVTDLTNLISNRAAGNYQLLGYPDPESARDAARDIATGLAGEKHGKRILHRNGGFFENLGNGLVRFATIGLESDALGIQRRNLDRGQFGFREATEKRWNGSEAEHNEADAALVKVLDGAIAAAKTGTPVGQIAATGLTLTMDPDRAENQGATQTFGALAATLTPAQLKTVDNQMVANLDNAGKRYVTAALDKAIKAGILAGEKVVVVTEEQARAAQASGGVVALTAEQKATIGDVPKGSKIYYTTASQAAALAAAKAGDVSDALRAQIINTSDDPNKVSQNQMNASSLTRMAAASPQAFTSVVTSAILDAEKAGNAQLAASLRAGVDDMRHGQGGAGDSLSSHITRAVKAGGVSNEAHAEYFSGRFAKNRAIAAQNLAGNLASDPATSAAVAASAKALLAGLPVAAQDRLLAIGSIKDPAEHAKALKAFGEEFADQVNTIHAERGLSLVELAKWVVLVKALTDKPKNPEDPELPRGEPPKPLDPKCVTTTECGIPTPPTQPKPPVDLPVKPTPPTPPIDKPPTPIGPPVDVAVPTPPLNTGGLPVQPPLGKTPG